MIELTDLIVPFTERKFLLWMFTITSFDDWKHDDTFYYYNFFFELPAVFLGIISYAHIDYYTHTHTIAFSLLLSPVFLFEMNWICLNQDWWCHVQLDIRSNQLVAPLPDEIKDGQWLGVTVRSQGPGRKVLVSWLFFFREQFLSHYRLPPLRKRKDQPGCLSCSFSFVTAQMRWAKWCTSQLLGLRISSCCVNISFPFFLSIRKIKGKLHTGHANWINNVVTPPKTKKAPR